MDVMKLYIGLFQMLAAYATFPFVPVDYIAAVKKIFEVVKWAISVMDQFV